jgi:hypothetical protein
MSYDMIIPTVPKVSYYSPLIAPAILKSCLEKEGYRCKIIDWNRDLYNLFQEIRGIQMFTLDSLAFHDEDVFEYMWEKYLKKSTEVFVDELKRHESEWIGIPFFSLQTKLMGNRLVRTIREKMTDTKILAGGDTMKYYGKVLKEKGLIDHYVVGEGENAILKVMAGEMDYAGIDGNPPDIVDINSIPIPDYSDLDMGQYDAASVVGSRGCINKCKFCDVNYYSSKFRQRKAELIVEEMVNIKERYGINKIFFADNLINGSIKEFRKMTHLLQGKRIKWNGQMVCKSRMVEEDYKMAARAGCIGGYFGIESGSEKVRESMGKKLTNETLYKTLEYMTKYNIKSQIMLIVGWPSETEVDFEETLNMIRKVAKEKYYIEHINLGPTYTFSKYQWGQDEFNLKFDKHGKWVYKDNTMVVRMKRWMRLYDLCKELGLPINAKHRHTIKKLMEKYHAI